MQNVVLNQKLFLETFPEISLDPESYGMFKDVKILSVNLYKKSRKLEIFVSSDLLIPTKVFFYIEQKMKEIFKLDSISIKPKFNLILSLEEIVRVYWDSILFYIHQKVALSRGIMAGAKAMCADKKLIVKLNTKGSEILKAQSCHTILESLLEDFFEQKAKIEFEDYQINEEVKGEYLEIKENEEAKAVSNVVVIPKEKKTPGTKNSSGGKEGTSQSGASLGIILGKNFNDSRMDIRDVTPDSGKVAVSGEIFSVEFRELRGGKFLCTFDITDYTSSLTCKIFVEKDNVNAMKERIKPGIVAKIRGEAQYDKFSKELAVFTSDIIELEKEVKMDNAEEKRVELHLHTQMSAMDGVTSVKELVKRAAQWGHKAIAITDHGVVQAFPDAMDAAKKNKIKVIYGIECYLLDDSVPIVYQSNGQTLDDEFVVLDIETTGLNAEKDKITEIGAVKIKNGKIIGKFSSFVNPEIPIPSMIVKLTGITNEMVQDSPTIEPVLLELLEFINGATVVAHNAPFDLGFIRHNAKKIGEHIHCPVVDTLQLCRRLFPDLGRYRLNIVANHLGIKLENHHRAIDDSKATAEIFIKCLELLKEKGVSTINEIEGVLDQNEDYKKAASYHAVILVKNYTGLKNLYKIVSYSHLKYFHKRPRVPKKLLMKYREGLIIGTACEAGELYTAILDHKGDDEITKLVRFYDYLEIQPLGNNQFLINNGKVRSQEELKNINRKIVRLGEKFKKPVVATCDVHFMDPRDEVFRRILMAGKGFSDADNQAPLYFRTTGEMLDEFQYLGNEKAYEVVVTNTNKIADMVDEIIPIPDGTFPPRIEGAEEEIKNLAEGKAKEIYGDPLPEVVEKRLEKELNSIIKNGFSVMYIIAQKLVWKSLSDGYLVGSRGSVGSSFVAYLVGITEVNSLPPHYICQNCGKSEFILDGSFGCGFDLPEKNCPECGSEMKKDGYDIPFETFLGFDGDKEPDIDLNFSGEYQPVAHKYTEELFGEGHVYRAGTIATVAEKTAYGYVKNYLDERDIIVPNAEINRLVKGCTGIKRTTGQHPGGVMIVPQDNEIFEFCPVQRPADDVESNTITTHFDYHSISGRLLKLDILGHDDPTVIRMLEDLTGVNARTIPIGEKKTMGIFSSTEPLGVKPEDINSEVGTFAIPEFGTKFVRQMLVDTKPTTFSELIRISGLSHGTDVWLNNAQDLVRNGVAALPEVICTRDDIMLYLIYSGLPPKTSFKIMEDVRKGKGLKEEYEQIMRENKVPEWYIESCKKIKYMFPKAHAAAYVMMAFRIAWFKVYYPEAFYVTYFTVRADEFDAELMTHGQDKVRNKIRQMEQKGNDLTQKEKNVLTILEVTNEMYARGIQFLPVDLYKSDAMKFQITPQGIRPPLNALQGLGGAAAQNIVEARKYGNFLSIDELRIRAKISKAVIEILQQQGCLDGLPESNQLSLF
ncbi:MAG: PolC-type DNA polymerase III [Clostridia bacterium]|nr:PolC-type DNA polymerase III [Clostridia bacterium]